MPFTLQSHCDSPLAPPPSLSLFVNPAHRGLRLGELLSQFIITIAAEDGYTHVVLDTLERLPHATALYKRLGFEAVPRYNDNPMHDVQFFGRTTTRAFV